MNTTTSISTIIILLLLSQIKLFAQKPDTLDFVHFFGMESYILHQDNTFHFQTSSCVFTIFGEGIYKKKKHKYIFIFPRSKMNRDLEGLDYFYNDIITKNYKRIYHCSSTDEYYCFIKHCRNYKDGIIYKWKEKRAYTLLTKIKKITNRS